MNVQCMLAIAAAGAVGAVSRYLLGELVRSAGVAAPWPTLVINLVGCLLFGLALGLAQERWSPLLQTTVLVGFLGAFTTFSAFAYDGVVLLEARRFGALAINLIVQNAGGLAAAWGGLRLMTWLRGS